MHKWLRTATAAALFAVLAAGCAKPAASPDVESEPTSPIEAEAPAGEAPAVEEPTRIETEPQESTDGIPFTVIEEDAYPEFVQQLMEEQDLLTAPGFHTFADKASGQVYVLIAAGEKPTAGYGIEVLRVEDAEEATQVVYRVVEPDPERLHAEVITKPHVLIALQDTGKEIVGVEVKD